MKIKIWAASLAAAGILAGLVAATAEAQNYVLRFRVPGLEGFGAPTSPGGAVEPLQAVSLLPDGTLVDDAWPDDYQVSGDGVLIAFTTTLAGRSESYVYNRATGVTTPITLSHDGATVASHAQLVDISHDGRFILFFAHKNDLVFGDRDDQNNAFIRDMHMGVTEKLPLHHEYQVTEISADGRYVLYATDQAMLWRFDTWSWAHEPVSVAWNGDVQPGDPSWYGDSMSADGNLIYFTSGAQMENGPYTNEDELYLRNMAAGTTERVSKAFDGTFIDNGMQRIADVSADGNVVLLGSRAENLLYNGNPGYPSGGIRYTRSTDSFDAPIRRLNGDPGGVSEDGSIYIVWGGMSDDGTQACFSSNDPDLVAVPDPENRPADQMNVYRIDFTTGVITLISADPDGHPDPEGTDDEFSVRMSADGSDCLFHANAPLLGEGASNGRLYLHTTDTTAPSAPAWSGAPTRPDWPSLEVVATGHDGSQANEWVGQFAHHFDSSGNLYFFEAGATNLINGITPAHRYVYVKNRSSEAVELVSLSHDGSMPNDDVWLIGVSGDGQKVLMHSRASNMVPGAPVHGIYMRDRGAGTTSLVLDTQNGMIFARSLSADGRYISVIGQRLIPGQTGTEFQIYRYDTQTGIFETASRPFGGTYADESPGRVDWNAVLSADARFMIFVYEGAELLAPGVDTNGQPDVYVHDFSNGETWRVLADDGSQLNGGSLLSSISQNGRYAMVHTQASNAISGIDRSGALLRLDLQTQEIRLIDDPYGEEDWVQTYPYYMTISNDGNRICSMAWNDDMHPKDVNGQPDAFMIDMATDEVFWLTAAATGTTSNLSDDTPYMILPDGSGCVFRESGGGLVAPGYPQDIPGFYFALLP